MPITHQAPQTEDGQIKEVRRDPEQGLVIRAEFELSEDLQSRARSPGAVIQFAARSRIARLSIDIRPLSEIEIHGPVASLVASVRSVVASYGIEDLLGEVFLPGLPVGRLVICDQAQRLTSQETYQQYSENAFKLPAAFSIDYTGRFTIQPHRVVYDLQKHPTTDDLLAILLRPDGRSLLNRLQVAREVDNIVLEPGCGVITSCTMFLHRHYVVLESDPTELGRHMHAVVLDPITTRGPRIFLEFFNESDQTIVNPSVTGVIYAAEPVSTHVKTWDGGWAKSSDGELPPATSEYVRLVELFDGCEDTEAPDSYFNRAVAVIPERTNGFDEELANVAWTRPNIEATSQIDNRAAQCRVASNGSDARNFGTRLLAHVPKGGRRTVLLRNFPNLAEHLEISRAATAGKIRRLVFRKASFEHGPFLSARDHARLADFADLGLEVFWCNDPRRHVATHVFRGQRGFFCEIDQVEAFRSALVVAIYGSSKPLPPNECDRLGGLL
ncbi:MAG: LOG family protein, partial [Planctomycetota bacterium]